MCVCVSVCVVRAYVCVACECVCVRMCMCVCVCDGSLKHFSTLQERAVKRRRKTKESNGGSLGLIMHPVSVSCSLFHLQLKYNYSY